MDPSPSQNQSQDQDRYENQNPNLQVQSLLPLSVPMPVSFNKEFSGTDTDISNTVKVTNIRPLGHCYSMPNSNITLNQYQGQSEQRSEIKVRQVSAVSSSSSSSTTCLSSSSTDAADSISNPTKTKIKNQNQRQAYQCRYCLLPFHIKEYRRRHESISHKFICSYKSCSLRFTQQLFCENHEKICIRKADGGVDIDTVTSTSTNIATATTGSGNVNVSIATKELMQKQNSMSKPKPMESLFLSLKSNSLLNFMSKSEAKTQIQTDSRQHFATPLIQNASVSNFNPNTNTIKQIPLPEKSSPQPQFMSIPVPVIVPNLFKLKEQEERLRCLPSPSYKISKTGFVSGLEVEGKTRTTLGIVPKSPRPMDEDTDYSIEDDDDNKNMKKRRIISSANTLVYQSEGEVDDDDDDDDDESNPLQLAQVVYTENEEETDTDNEYDNDNDKDTNHHESEFESDPDQETDPDNSHDGDGASTDSDNFQIFKCNQCDNHYLSQKDLNNHMEQFHKVATMNENKQRQLMLANGSVTIAKPKPKPTPNTNTNLDCTAQVSINEKVKSKGKTQLQLNPFICHYCPMSFTQEWLRLTHMQSHHWIELANEDTLSPATTPRKQYSYCNSNQNSRTNVTPKHSPQNQGQGSSLFQKYKYNLRKSALKRYSHTKPPKPLTPLHVRQPVPMSVSMLVRKSKVTPEPSSDPMVTSTTARCEADSSSSRLRQNQPEPTSSSPQPKKDAANTTTISSATVNSNQNQNEVNPTMPVRNENHKYNCSFCGKEVSTRQYLQVHERIHTGIKPFKCPYKNCRKAFIRKQSMVNHVRVHTGEKPYGCSICGRYFRVITNLYQHTETHGEIDPALKPYRRISPPISTTTTTISNNSSTAKVSLTTNTRRYARKKTWSRMGSGSIYGRVNYGNVSDIEMASTAIMRNTMSMAMSMATPNNDHSQNHNHSTLQNRNKNQHQNSYPHFMHCGKMESEDNENDSERIHDEEIDPELKTESEPVANRELEATLTFHGIKIKVDPECCEASMTSTANYIKSLPQSTVSEKSQSHNCQRDQNRVQGDFVMKPSGKPKYVPLPLPSTITQVLDIHVVQYICNICDRKFSYRAEAVQHVHSFHQNYDP